jgi:hypothetical protein
MRTPSDVTRGFYAVRARHFHIEEADIRSLGVKEIHRFATVAGLRNDDQFRPRTGEKSFELFAQQRFIVGDQSGGSL